jgi:peptide/nickel transport system permease protein
MGRYIVRRSLYGLLVLLGVNLATFFLFFTVNTPDDMARLNIGGKRVTRKSSTSGRPSAATTSRCT